MFIGVHRPDPRLNPYSPNKHAAMKPYNLTNKAGSYIFHNKPMNFTQGGRHCTPACLVPRPQQAQAVAWSSPSSGHMAKSVLADALQTLLQARVGAGTTAATWRPTPARRSSRCAGSLQTDFVLPMPPPWQQVGLRWLKPMHVRRRTWRSTSPPTASCCPRTRGSTGWACRAPAAAGPTSPGWTTGRPAPATAASTTPTGAASGPRP
jgi:hypothetical protein